MSVRERVEDALVLWNSGRRQGAFLLALTAVAATSRKMFPAQSTGDREAFEAFLRHGWFERISVEYRGKAQPIYHIFYKWFRCELVHEGSLPLDVKVVSDPEPGVLMVRAGGAPEYVLKVSLGWFAELIEAVTTADVNSEEFAVGEKDSKWKNKA